MLKMAAQLETIVNTYKTLAKIPAVAGGKLNKAGTKVSVNWSVRNLDAGKNTKYATTYTLDEELRAVEQSEFPADVSNVLLSAVSPSETFKAIIREEKSGKDAKKQYLEVWRRSTLAHCIDLTALDLHGDVYADSEFGNLDWNHDESKLVYVAEKKLPKYEPYIKRKPPKEQKKGEDSNGAGDDAPKKGEEFLYRQDWGEQLAGKYHSVIVVCSIQDESLSVLDHLPAGWCPGQLETIVNTYKTLAKIPAVAGGKLNKAGTKVSVNWSVRNLDAGKNTKYATTYTLDEELRAVEQSEFPADVSNVLLSAVSPSETFKAIIREEKSGKDAKKQYLEVWRRSTLAHCIDLTALDLHGDVYADSEFGNLDWNHDESKLVYVAEKKLPKYEPYIKRKPPKEQKKGEDSNGAGDDAPKKGEEFLYRQDWGEQLAGKYHSVIVVCSIQDESLSVLDHLPAGWCPGQMVFAPDGSRVVGVAWPTEPRRLGLIFCTNRPSYIFSLSLDGKIMTKYSSEGKAVRSPRYRPGGDLVWLQRAADGPHHACHEIVAWRDSTEKVISLVDIVQTEKKIVNGEVFYGAYNQSVPKHCFAQDGRLVFCTPQKNEVRIYVVHPESGHMTDISIRSAAGSITVLDVQSDVILATHSNLTTPGEVYAARLPPAGSEAAIKWVRVSETTHPLPISSSHTEYLQLTHDNNDDVNSFSAIYFAPKTEEGKKLPLIVWPHGGPHSGFVNAYSLEAAFFNMLGFAVIQINYRGSTGAGDAFLRYLPGKAGDADVKDCKLATDVALDKFPINSRQVMLAGGSHGGFLVTHLSGQYPDTYRAVVSRNPVVDVATMYNYTDINDCMLGFASIRCNYRGSSGAGDASARCLGGHVGEYDVSDCYLALTTLLERDGASHVLLYGGSYGGLVVAHLAAKYPTLFQAMVMRNPLIDLATKGQYADNSDGCAVEAGFEWTEAGPINEEQLVSMRRCSPLAHVHRVKAPTAMMLGSADRRVPYYQGLEYIRRLRANGVDTRIYMYEDNHSLSSPPAEMDNLINGAHWFISHLGE